MTWDFKDGSTAEGTEVSHAWTTEGQFTVQMTAANAQGSSIATRTVTIVASVEQPTAGIEVSSSSVFTGESVRLTSTSEGEPTNFSWSFGDDASASGPSVSHSWDEPGRYNVTLNVSNSAGQSEATTQIEVRARTLKPEAKIGVDTTSVEAGGTIAFQNQSTNDPTELRWEFGDGETSGDANPTHQWDDEGTYTVKLTASNEAGDDTAEVKIKVLPPRDPAPEADFRVRRPNNIRTGDAARFDDRSENNPTSWAWTFGDGGTSTDENPQHVYVVPGKYDVTLVVSNARDSDSITKEVTVGGQTIAPPIASFQYPTNQTWRVAQNVPFTDTSQGEPTSWRWNFGDGATSTAENPSHAFAGAATYTVELIIRDAAGRESRTTQSVTIATAEDAVPDPAFTYAPEPVIAGLPITFTDTSPRQATLTPPVWTFAAGPNGTVTSAADRTAVWNFAAAQQVTVRMQVCLLTNISACKTAVQTFDVLPAPTAPIAAFRLAGAAKPARLGANEALINLPLQLIDESTGDALDDPQSTFVWTIEGRQLTGRTVQTQVTTLGLVPISLEVTTPHGTNILTKQITFLSNVPTVAAIAAPATGVFGQPVTFTDASTGGPTAWKWEFDDGSPDVTTPNVNHVFTDVGPHTVTLTVTNHLGSTSAVHLITISPPAPLVPSIGVSLGGVAVPPPVSIPLGETLVFTDTTPVPQFQTTTRVWTIAGLPGAPTTPSVSHAWDTPGQKVVTLRVIDQFGRPRSTSVTVTVLAPVTTTTTTSTPAPTTTTSIPD